MLNICIKLLSASLCLLVFSCLFVLENNWFLYNLIYALICFFLFNMFFSVLYAIGSLYASTLFCINFLLFYMLLLNSIAFPSVKSLCSFIFMLKYSFFLLLIYHNRYRLLNIAGNTPTAYYFYYNAIHTLQLSFLPTVYPFYKCKLNLLFPKFFLNIGLE